MASFQVPEQITAAVSELARSQHTTVNIVLQGAYAQLLCGLTGQHDVVFGTTVSGRPAELPGAESMVGLLINTVPVRATITAATTTADLLDQLHHAHNHTLDHQHLALSDIHRITGHEQLFDTLFVYENYPIDTTALSGVDGLAVTEFSTREYNHYPLAIQALPGTELGLRVEYDTEVFDTADIDTLFDALHRAAGGHDHRPHRRAVVDRCARCRRTRPPRWVGQPGGVDRARPRAGLDSGAVRRAGGPHPGGGGGDLRGPVVDLPGTRRGRQPVGAPAGRPRRGPGTVCGAVVAAFGCRRSWRSWRCSRPGRPICRSTPHCPAARIEFMLDDAAPIAAITTTELRPRLDGCDLPVIESTTPPSTASPAPHYRRRPPTTSPT